MEKYTKAEMEIIAFEAEDVITESNPCNDNACDPHEGCDLE